MRHLRLPSLRAEHGLTLTELLVTAAVSLIVVGAAGATLALAVAAWNGQSKRTDAFDQGRAAFVEMSRELRQAVDVTQISSRVLQARVAVGDGANRPLHVIRYDCSRPGRTAATRACFRVDVTGGGERRLWVDVSNSDVFTSAPASRFVRIRIVQAPTDGGEPFVLEGGVTARSCPQGEGTLGGC